MNGKVYFERGAFDLIQRSPIPTAQTEHRFDKLLLQWGVNCVLISSFVRHAGKNFAMCVEPDGGGVQWPGRVAECGQAEAFVLRHVGPCSDIGGAKLP